MASATPKPAEKHFPCTAQEIDAWLSRVNEISTAVSDFLSTDEQVEAERLRKREAALRAKEAEKRRKVVDRYDPKHYKLFEDDALIEKLLKEADDDGHVKRMGEIPELTDFERIALEESQRLKKEGNSAFVARDFLRARECYDSAIGMGVVDPELLSSLHNNRAQVHLRLGSFIPCIEDASFVLQRDRHNVKALLRRAAALEGMRKPIQALDDVDKVLTIDSTNTEAYRIKKSLEPAIQEVKLQESFCALFPDDAELLLQKIEQLKELIPTADTRKYDITALLCELGQLLRAEGSCVMFRFHLDPMLLIPVVESVCGIGTPQDALLLASAFRLLALVLDSPVAIREEKIAVLIPMVAPLAKAAHPILQSAALRLLASVCNEGDRWRSAVVEHFDIATLNGLIHVSSPITPMAMKLCDCLLKSPIIAETAGQALALRDPLIEAIQSTQPLLREAGASLLLRATTSRYHLVELLAQDDAAACLSKVIESIDFCDPTRDTVTLEGLLASMYNITIAQRDRESASRFLLSRGAIRKSLLLLEVFARDPDACPTNVAARAIGVIANCCKVATREMMDHISLFVSLLSRTRATVSSSAVYEDQLAQNAALICAAVALSDTCSESALATLAFSVSSFVSLTLCDNFQTVGNAALVIGALLPRFAADVSSACAVPVLLDSVKKLRAAMHQLEHDGLAVSSEHQRAKSAQRNVGIALSKCCKFEDMLQQLRELNGIEILYASLGKEGAL